MFLFIDTRDVDAIGDKGLHLCLFISPVLFYISTWNSVCIKLKMIPTIILLKDKFKGLTKPEIRGWAFRPPPVTLEA